MSGLENLYKAFLHVATMIMLNVWTYMQENELLLKAQSFFLIWQIYFRRKDNYTN